ncbi:hypothetical protein [Leucobacter chromiireducens]|uniref:hypothetical protein n=1 Tax=Leucobacter chromiireducens TaxID=283877 RepID=UPI003F807D99
MTLTPTPKIFDTFRSQLEPAYRHIGVAAVSHAAFEARMNQLIESLKPEGEPFATAAGRSYLPRRNMEMSKRLDALVAANVVTGNLQAQLMQLQSAEHELRNLRNSVVHSFVSDPYPDNPNVVYFEDARTELGPNRVRRNIQALWEATVRITDEAAILGAIAGVIFDRIFATIKEGPDTVAPAVSVNSSDPDFARKFTAFVKKGLWLGWAAGGDEPDSDWWRK